MNEMVTCVPIQHVQAKLGQEPPEDGEINQITLSFRHRIRNSSPVGLRPSEYVVMVWPTISAGYTMVYLIIPVYQVLHPMISYVTVIIFDQAQFNRKTLQNTILYYRENVEATQVLLTVDRYGLPVKYRSCSSILEKEGLLCDYTGQYYNYADGEL